MDGDNDCNEPPLTAAVAAGRKDVVTLLLDKGADVNKADYTAAAPPSIHLATSAEMIDLLVDRGADVLARDGLGNSAIVSALVGDYKIPELVPTLKRLVELGELTWAAAMK